MGDAGPDPWHHAARDQSGLYSLHDACSENAHGFSAYWVPGCPQLAVLLTFRQMATVGFGDFEWDDQKARQNQDKHGVSFEEAASVFSDLNYVLISYEMHPNRYLALGYSSLARLLVVVHCEPAGKIRIIGARKATKAEAKAYERDN